jgi:2-amino-4-hydroxy-6-hydroxymethyldihydropteridine diphosphokinase
MKHQILISVGSNINKESNTEKGLQALHDCFGELVLSTIYESESVGFSGDNFLNSVVLAYTNMSIQDVCTQLKLIENNQGRIRDKKFGNRTLDLDLLTFDNVVSNTPVILPRREIEYNAFVLKAIAEIVPNQVHPTRHKNYATLWNEFLLHNPNKNQRLWPSGYTWSGPK